MVERVERDVDIVVQGTSAPQEPAIIDGRVVSSVESVGPGGDLDGTVETVSGPNGLVIVDGTVIEHDTVEMQPGQILTGGGTTFAVIGENSGATTTFTTPGAAGTINNTTDFNDVVSLASNTTVPGLSITGGGVSAYWVTAPKTLA